MCVPMYNRKTRKFERFWIYADLNESTKTGRVPQQIKTNYMQVLTCRVLPELLVIQSSNGRLSSSQINQNSFQKSTGAKNCFLKAIPADRLRIGKR